MSATGSVNVTDRIQEVIRTTEFPDPSDALLSTWFMKWKEALLYEASGESDWSFPAHELRNELVHLDLERLRKEIVEIDEQITEHFSEVEEPDSWHIEYVGGSQAEIDIDLEFVEYFVRDVLLTNRVLTFYNAYLEAMKVRQSWGLLRVVFGRSFGEEQRECMEYVKDNMSYDQREYLLYWSGEISDDLRSNMARIRGRRNSIIHSNEAGYIDGVRHAINDLSLCVEVMQTLADLDNSRTPLGRFDTIEEVLSEDNTLDSE